MMCLWRTGIRFYPIVKNNTLMENKGGKKQGPKDRSYVNKSQEHEVKHEPKRKTPAKKFGGK
jgi:hypothetical protein